MTISTVTNRYAYAGNGVTTAFSYASKFLANGDLVVFEVNNSTGVATVKTITTHYTVTGAGNANGGTVTMVTAPASGTTLVIYGNPALTQGVDLVAGEDLSPDAGIETPLDRLTLITQRLGNRIDRSVRLADTDTSGASVILPIPSAGKLLKWNSLGTALENGSAADFPTAIIVTAESIGAVGDGVTDCTSAINTALASGYRVWLKHALTYKVTSSLLFPANGAGLLSDGTGKIYAPAASFNNATLANRYASNACVIYVAGQTSAPFTERRDIMIDGIIVESEVSGGRLVDGIAARNVTNLQITNCQIFGFPVGCGIRASSLLGRVRIDNNYIHTFADNTNWTPQTGPQLTGIEIDNDRVNSISSVAVDLSHNHIRDLVPGATFIAAHGDQSDGINVHAGTQFTVARNRISNVAEGIDFFASKSTLVGNAIDDVNIGIKLIHGASWNAVGGNQIHAFTLAGIALYGTSTGSQAAAANTITGNAISGGVADASTATQACIRVDSTTETFKTTNNLIADNILDPGSADYAIWHRSTGTGNVYQNNRIVAAGGLGRISIDLVDGTETPLIEEALKTSVRVGRATVQSITNGVDTKIEFATEQIDRRAEYDNATNFRWTCQIPGPYQAEHTVRFGTMADGALVTLAIKKNGTTVAIKQMKSGGANDVSYSISDTVICAVGDYIEFFVQQDDAAARDIAGNVTLCYASINPA